MNDQPVTLNAWATEHGIMPPSATNLSLIPALELPQIKSAADALSHPPALPPELVHGLIHAGTKIMLSGASKSYKTWCAMDLGLSVSLGKPWLKFNTTQGRVLYLDLELHEAFFARRIAAICKARDFTDPLDFEFCTLRGVMRPAHELLAAIVKKIEGKKYALIIVEPIYKLLSGRDESSAGHITEMLNRLEWVAVQTGAAVLFAAHHSKGNQAGKDVLDRVSGSGVFARDPDTILTMTRHEEDGSFVVETVLRNFPQTPAFCLRWEYPVMQSADDLDPADMKTPARGHRPGKHEPTMEEFLSIFPDHWEKETTEAILTSADISAAFKKNGWDPRKIRELRENAVKNSLIQVHRGHRNKLSIGRPQMIQDWLAKEEMLSPPGDI